MDKQQLDALTHHEEEVNTMIRLQSSDYTRTATRDPKTLLYGYDCARNTHHVYQDFNGFIYIYVYRPNGLKAESVIAKVDVSEEGIKSLESLIPDKRLYPQYCDYDFCVYLKERGVNLPFTNYTEPRTGSTRNPKSVFHGEIF